MSRIAFGSCNNQDLSNNLWRVIESRKPTAFVWGGDAIYADKHTSIDWTTFPPSSRVECATPDRLRTLYKFQRSVPGYKQLVESNITVFGTFDDHDFGCNNGDSTFKYRHESGIAFVDFIGESAQSPIRMRAQEGLGVYGVKMFDFARPTGSQALSDWEACIDPDICTEEVSSRTLERLSNKTVAVFVLDVRTNKSPWKTGSAAFSPDYEGDFLGDRQWQWLEIALGRTKAAVNVIVNGLQVHANRFSNANVAESWDKFPLSRDRLYRTILQQNVRTPILISGDVHMTQLMRKDCFKPCSHEYPHPLLELTTSGMTHSWGSLPNPPLFDRKSSGRSILNGFGHFLGSTLMRFMHKLCPWTELLESRSEDVLKGSYENGGAEGSKQGLQYSLQKNFGELEFDWEQNRVSVRSIGENGQPLLSARLSFDQLSGVDPIQTVTPAAFESFDTGNTPARCDWVCVNNRGVASPKEYLNGQVQSILFTGLVAVSPVLLFAAVVWILRRQIAKERDIRQPLDCGIGLSR